MCALAHDPVNFTSSYILCNDNKNHANFDNIFLGLKQNQYDEIRIIHTKLQNGVANNLYTIMKIEKYITLNNIIVLAKETKVRKEYRQHLHRLPMGIVV